MRVATADDTEGLEELEGLLFPDNNLNARMLANELEHGQGWVVEEEEGLLVAYALLRTDHLLGDLTRLGVRPGYQDKGLGTQLLRHAMRQCSSMMLMVHKQNEAALRLYQRHGFKIVGATANGSWVLRTTSNE